MLISVHHDGNHDSPDQVARTIGLADRFVAEGTASVMEPFFAALVDDRSDGAALKGTAAQEPFEPMDQLARINQPTLVIAGDDSLHPRALAEQYAKIIPGAQLADVGDDWGEHTTVQTRAETLTPVISDFIRVSRASL